MAEEGRTGASHRGRTRASQAATRGHHRQPHAQAAPTIVPISQTTTRAWLPRRPLKNARAEVPCHGAVQKGLTVQQSSAQPAKPRPRLSDLSPSECPSPPACPLRGSRAGLTPEAPCPHHLSFALPGYPRPSPSPASRMSQHLLQPEGLEDPRGQVAWAGTKEGQPREEKGTAPVMYCRPWVRRLQS